MVSKDIPVLIQGESGVGKGCSPKPSTSLAIAARVRLSLLNCAAIPENLIESELFGYLGGALPAPARKAWWERSSRPMAERCFSTRSAICRSICRHACCVLQERCVTPLGGVKPVPMNLSLVCATHRRLRDEVARQLPRRPFYRINGLTSLPTLRERSDIAQLVENLLALEAGCDSTIVVAEDVSNSSAATTGRAISASCTT